MLHIPHSSLHELPQAEQAVSHPSFAEPTEVWHGEQDIYLYYRRINHHWLVAVARHLNGDGFLINAYKTRKKKRKGTIVWPKGK